MARDFKNGITVNGAAVPTVASAQTWTGVNTFGAGKLIMTSTNGTGEPYSDANPPQTLNLTDQGSTPATPPAGQSTLYTTAGKQLKLLDNDATEMNVAMMSGGAKITVATTAPSSPTTGDLWVDTN